MNNIQKLGFDNWFANKVDLSKTIDLKIARVISVDKTLKGLCSLLGANGEIL